MANVKERLIGWLDSHLAFRLVQAGVAISLILGFASSYQTYIAVQCQARYSNIASRAQAIRDASDRADRRSFDNMLNVILTSSDRYVSYQALVAYQRQRAEADQYRREHPLPVPPHC